MHIFNSTQNLPDYTSCFILGKLTIFHHEIKDLSTGAKLCNKHKSFCILKVVNCFGDTMMIQDFHDINFSQKAQLSFIVHIRLAENFDGSELLTCRLVAHIFERDCVAFPDFSVSTLSEWIIDDPIMVSHSPLMFCWLELYSLADTLDHLIHHSCLLLWEILCFDWAFMFVLLIFYNVNLWNWPHFQPNRFCWLLIGSLLNICTICFRFQLFLFITPDIITRLNSLLDLIGSSWSHFSRR